ncbi:MAG: YlmH/Sll1252 family protein [Cetobacterium sp.]|uniref:YlmH/Sll1252 family protein n=1 Tax=Cetobacterium sp. TaxID=2071632 RepID=UPI0025BB41EE|nr:YlmH/Sll1252 family protein [Cetobacterium sp.]
MNKKYFFNLFPNEDEFLIASIWEDLSLCLDIDYPVYGSIFLPPQIWTKLYDVCTSINLEIYTLGLTPDSEKKLVIFTPKFFDSSSLEEVVTYFKIDASNKFKTLQHKDFLGTIMGLGFKREILGDIIVKDNIGYCITTKDIFNIIKNNLSQINTIPVNISTISTSQIPQLEFKEITDTISSFRLDSIIASIANSSRNISTNLIESGDVLVNYNIEKSKNKIINIGSVITIRKKGKFILEKNLGENKKGKFKILIKQYI